jgi:hypothetical protein
MLPFRFAIWMAWGPELTFLRNNAYLPTVGLRRDWVIRTRSDKVWAEIWSAVGPRIEHGLATREASWDEALLLYLERRGFGEETYHTCPYSLLAEDGDTTNGRLFTSRSPLGTTHLPPDHVKRMAAHAANTEAAGAEGVAGDETGDGETVVVVEGASQSAHSGRSGCRGGASLGALHPQLSTARQGRFADRHGLRSGGHEPGRRRRACSRASAMDRRSPR